MTTLYGIKSCDSVKKARAWLKQQQIDYEFHDFRIAGLSEQRLDAWLALVDWSCLLNKRSTTWRQLSDNDKAELNPAKVRALLLSHPTLIKRPVLEHQGQCLVGFKPLLFEQLFKL